MRPDGPAREIVADTLAACAGPAKNASAPARTAKDAVIEAFLATFVIGDPFLGRLKDRARSSVPTPYRRAQTATPLEEGIVANVTMCVPRSLLFGLRRCLFAGNVQQILDCAHSLDFARLGAQIFDQVRLLELAAEIDDTVLDVDVDLPLGHIGAAEDLALDLARQRDVVGLRLLLLGEVGRLRLQALGLGRDGLRLPAGLTKRLGGSLDCFLAALAAVVGIEEVRESSSNCSCKDESRHQSDTP